LKKHFEILSSIEEKRQNFEIILGFEINIWPLRLARETIFINKRKIFLFKFLFFFATE
jgi:hypothetical protein